MYLRNSDETSFRMPAVYHRVVRTAIEDRKCVGKIDSVFLDIAETLLFVPYELRIYLPVPV
jgi:hypothetical protein